MTSVPSYGKWTYHIARKWNPADPKEKTRLVGFALILASWANGSTNEICPSAATVAKHAGMHERTVKRYRAECVRAGLFTATGSYCNGVPVLVRSIPAGTADTRNAEDIPLCGGPHEPWEESTCIWCIKIKQDANQTRLPA